MTPRRRKGSAVESKIEKASADVLARLVFDLCSLGDENKAFVEARLEATSEPLKSYKKRIDEALYPDVMSRQPIRIGAARRAVTEYKKAAGDLPGVLELMMYYVERGTACTADYGDIDEAFYSSLESMYDRLLKILDTGDGKTKESFRSRAAAVVDRAKGIGWGYYDYLADRFAESYG